jgi:hypothetical protein
MQVNGRQTQNRHNGRQSPASRILPFEKKAVTAKSFSPSPEPILSDVEPFVYRSQFQDCMEMNAVPQTVADYLRAHQDWFHRCAHPMQVESIGANAYALVIGQFGALGYDLEPKFGLNLLPQGDRQFRITTVPLPDDGCAGYTVDFKANMDLAESSIPERSITQVEWDLDLMVSIRFPRFIYHLPNGVIQSTGDRVLRQIVRQVSRRLTRRVQHDFHSTYGLAIPSK